MPVICKYRIYVLTTQKINPTMPTFYALISHGPNPRYRPQEYRQTLASYKLFELAMERASVDSDFNFLFDYARKVDDLSSLPVLKELLKVSMTQNARFITDDFRRIFARCPLDNRIALLNEIREHGQHFKDLRTRQSITELSDNLVRSIVLHQGPVRFQLPGTNKKTEPTAKGRRQTALATAVSRRARAYMADMKAEELAKLREELSSADHTPTLKQIADEANARGIQTTRGKDWSAASVQRQLKRLENKQTP